MYVTNLTPSPLGIDGFYHLTADQIDKFIPETEDLVARVAKLEAAGKVSVRGSDWVDATASEALAAGNFVNIYQTAAVTTATRARASNVATLTFGSAHGFNTGDRITVAAVGTGYDGAYKLVTKVDATTITYPSVGTDETETADVNGTAILSHNPVRAQKADATDATKPAKGFVLAAVASGKIGRVYLEGENDKLSALTSGSVYYLSAATPGAAVAAAPATASNIVQPLGFAMTPSCIRFEFETWTVVAGT